MAVLCSLYTHDNLASSFNSNLPALTLLKQQALRVLQDCSHDVALVICSQHLSEYGTNDGHDTPLKTDWTKGDTNVVSVVGKQLLEDIATIRRIGRVPLPDNSTDPIHARELLPTSKL